MEVKILDKQDNRLRFVVQGIDLAFANALRRIMISEVPSMAIEDVIIIENSSSMEDEILAHRLGMIPFKTDLDSYIFREKCECKSELGCGKCNVILTLEAEAKSSNYSVYSKDLVSSDPYVIPVSKKIPILKLSHNQKIRLEAYARLGTGSEHAKWQPVSACTVRQVSKIRINKEKCDVCESCVNACYKQILRVDGNKIEIINYENCNNCKQCEDACPQDAIKVGSEKNIFLFEVESTGVLAPERIFYSAIDILREKTKEFVSLLTDLKLEEEDSEKN